MANKYEIETRIRDSLPIIFGKADAVDEEAYLTQHNAALEFAVAKTEPVLTAETVRYQGILLYVSLILASLSLFNQGSFRFGDNPIIVDDRFHLLYSVFIAMVAVIFAIKSYVDFGRGQLARGRYDPSVVGLSNLLDLGRQRTDIQQYFWGAIADEVIATYQTVYTAKMRALNREPGFKPVQTTKCMTLDLDKLRETPEFAAEIDRQQGNLAAIRQDLARDKARFEERAEAAILSGADDVNRFSWDVYADVDKAFDDTLGPWFDAVNALVRDRMDWEFGELTGGLNLRRQQGLAKVLRRVVRIRKVHFLLEFLAPIAFAAFVVVWVRLA